MLKIVIHITNMLFIMILNNTIKVVFQLKKPFKHTLPLLDSEFFHPASIRHMSSTYQSSL
jgi:hypothetical protein